VEYSTWIHFYNDDWKFKMNEYWIWIRNSAGAPIRTTVYADNNYKAIEIARALYGPQLMSESANLVN
jgi:hypothetical protein